MTTGMDRGIWAVAIVAAFAGLANRQAVSGDWPQILGPERNGIAAADERLASKWPGRGPATVWEHPVGSGFAGVAVVGPRVILFHREDGEEVVESLDAATSNSQWRHGYPTTFYPSVGGGDGPLCVPTVAGDLVITYGAQGMLTATELESGKVRWQRPTHSEYHALEGYFGAGSCPLVVGQTVIVNVGGGRDNAGIVGFDLQTGQPKWTQTAEQASYSAPVAFTQDGTTLVIVITRLACMAIEPESGTVFWQYPFGQRGPTVNAALPIIFGEKKDHLFTTASYGIGAVYSDITLTSFNTVWQKDSVLSSQYSTPIEADGFLYGIHGRDDVPPSDLRCVEAKTGQMKWEEPNFGYATLISADSKLILCKTDGEVVLAEINTDRFAILARARLFSSTVRALPALSNGQLYIRDERVLKRFDVSAPRKR
jgi:outer membrane protein assembly factor BamB